jgi:hypothetical protein
VCGFVFAVSILLHSLVIDVVCLSIKQELDLNFLDTDYLAYSEQCSKYQTKPQMRTKRVVQRSLFNALVYLKIDDK